jgi:2-keto-3-deoxy-L-rhamnonate aldolase RhmA
MYLAKTADYETLFIDLEHTTISIRETNHLCMEALSVGIIPVVRVPHWCRNGFAQRVLDVRTVFITPNVNTAGKWHQFWFRRSPSFML